MTAGALAPSVEVDGLTVRYGEVTALDEATLQLQAGRVTGLIGMNGSGKSTLFKAIMGAVKPLHGTVRIGGTDPGRARRQGLIGYVPQAEAVDWAFPVSVRDVVMMGRYGRMGFTRRPRAADHRAVDEALARVELTELAHRQIGELSGGQKKRAFVARGIAQEAGVLLLDEPFAGVDKRSEATIVRLLRELAAGGATILVSTHDLHAVPGLADEAALLLRRVLFHGSVAEALSPERLAMAFGLAPGTALGTHAAAEAATDEEPRA
ncbi:manganese transport system ATP-binding protein [Leucobacter exalbidus]|uniref:Manganese transport system ATP-binding protein n=1 Tax=Leucobacter exalbidus TaxID=662960 RepID=A0A940T327_9MICO|nr:metal ABC transporter ATP-binding protein [Leucobacter exalbidus]MBP1325398.1 manganese transport system ATP-binding protein [Leucobacter exalbidus]